MPIAAFHAPLASAVILALGATVTLLFGLLRHPGTYWRFVPGSAFVLLTAVAFLVPSAWIRAAAIAAAAALLIHLIVGDRDRVEPRATGAGSGWVGAVYVAAAFLVAAVLLLHDLGGYAGSLQRWEAPVVGGIPDSGPCSTVQKTTRPHCSPPWGFAHFFEVGETVPGFVAQQFTWNFGTFSVGHTSLFYGAPTYALFHSYGFSTWTLRIAAVVATLLSVVVIYALGRRFFGPVVGSAAAVLFALNACALFYGRYGSSPAGTVLSVLLAVLCTWLFLNAERSAWWMAVPCAAMLYAATLQYAPARIVVLLLLGFIPLVLVWQWRRLRWPRLVGLAVIVAVGIGVWRFEAGVGQQSFLSGQGETFFHMTQYPEYVASFCPGCVPLRAKSEITYQVELLRRWLETTVPEYLGLIGPHPQSVPLADWDAPTLPQLYYAPLVVFIVWGFAHSLRRLRSWQHAFLLLWLAAATASLLLTNRVDSHRSLLLVVPLSLWGALGVWEAGRVMYRAGVPTGVQHLLAVSLALTVVANDLQLVWLERPDRATAAESLARQIEDIPGTVAVGAVLDPQYDTLRNLGFVELTLLERERRDPTRTGFFLSPTSLAALRDGGGPPAEPTLVEVEGVLRDATVVLAPSSQYRAAAVSLQERGARVDQRGGPGFPILLLEKGSQ
jgi:hypothetical protein